MTKKKKKSKNSSRILNKYYCPNCDYNFRRKEEQWFMMCPKCKLNARTTDMDGDNHVYTSSFSTIDMTPSPEYYKKKRFTLNDKKWKEDIQSRKTLPDGTVGRFRGNKRIG